MLRSQAMETLPSRCHRACNQRVSCFTISRRRVPSNLCVAVNCRTRQAAEVPDIRKRPDPHNLCQTAFKVQSERLRHSSDRDHLSHILGRSLAGLALSASLVLSPGAVDAKTVQGLSSDVTVYDGAGIIAGGKQQQLSNSLREFERETGWRVRVLTFKDPSEAPGEGQLREAWKPDRRSVIVQFDPTSPNIMNFPYIGDEVAAKLRRPFWTELQSRYGNLFYIRQEGEQEAVVNSLNALASCLGSPRGCTVVPGLPEDQYYFTLGTSIAGGLVAGFVSKLEPQGFVQRRWVWLLIFSPLWASLFINFGLGPIISRTEDKLPVIANTAAFLVAAFAPWAATSLLRQAPPPRAD